MPCDQHPTTPDPGCTNCFPKKQKTTVAPLATTPTSNLSNTGGTTQPVATDQNNVVMLDPPVLYIVNLDVNQGAGILFLLLQNDKIVLSLMVDGAFEENIDHVNKLVARDEEVLLSPKVLGPPPLAYGCMTHADRDHATCYKGLSPTKALFIPYQASWSTLPSSVKGMMGDLTRLPKLGEEPLIKDHLGNSDLRLDWLHVYDNTACKDWENSKSLAGLVTFGKFSYYFDGDLDDNRQTAQVLKNLTKMARPEKNTVDVSYVTHHGSRYTSPKRFIDELNPRVAIVSCGSNSFGHPDDIVLKRFTDEGKNLDRLMLFTSCYFNRKYVNPDYLAREQSNFLAWKNELTSGTVNGSRVDAKSWNDYAKSGRDFFASLFTSAWADAKGDGDIDADKWQEVLDSLRKESVTLFEKAEEWFNDLVKNRQAPTAEPEVLKALWTEATKRWAAMKPLPKEHFARMITCGSTKPTPTGALLGSVVIRVPDPGKQSYEIHYVRDGKYRRMVVDGRKPQSEEVYTPAPSSSAEKILKLAFTHKKSFAAWRNDFSLSNRGGRNPTALKLNTCRSCNVAIRPPDLQVVVECVVHAFGYFHVTCFFNAWKKRSSSGDSLNYKLGDPPKDVVRIAPQFGALLELKAALDSGAELMLRGALLACPSVHRDKYMPKESVITPASDWKVRKWDPVEDVKFIQELIAKLPEIDKAGTTESLKSYVELMSDTASLQWELKTDSDKAPTTSTAKRSRDDD